MTPEMVELGRAVVACKGWMWMPGMRALSKSRGKLTAIRVCDDIREWVARSNEFPDLTDHATLGCLLALVRKSYGDDEAWAQPWHDTDGGWTVTINEDDRCLIIAEGDTEVEALVAALEGAP